MPIDPRLVRGDSIIRRAGSQAELVDLPEALG
jgi:hypothetical protein